MRPLSDRHGERNPNWTDGRVHHPLYQTYMSMLRRCYNPQHTRYARYGGRGRHTLIECCRLWGIPLSQEQAHGAAADALAAGRLAWRLATDPYRFQQFDGPRGVERIHPGTWPLPELHRWQQEEKRRQADGFGKWLAKQDKPDDVSRDWPVQAPPPGWTPEDLPAPPPSDEGAA